MQSKVCYIVVAGGSGSRFGGELPKQFCELRGVPVVMHAIEALRRATPGAAIVMSLNPDYEKIWRELCEKHHFESPTTVGGGSTRWESVRNALAVAPSDADIIAVHDGARPVVETWVARGAVAAVESGAVGAVPVVAVTDSLRRIGDEGESESVDRSCFRAVQTPQAFLATALREAYGRGYRSEFTDDASVVEAAGYGPIVLCEGSDRNIKITHPADIEIASMYIDGRH